MNCKRTLFDLHNPINGGRNLNPPPWLQMTSQSHIGYSVQLSNGNPANPSCIRQSILQSIRQPPLTTCTIIMEEKFPLIWQNKTHHGPITSNRKSLSLIVTSMDPILDSSINNTRRVSPFSVPQLEECVT